MKDTNHKIMNGGKQRFIDSVIEQHGFTKKEAEHIYEVYYSLRVGTFDRVGQFNLSHGAFWDREPMENALKIEL